MDFGVHLPLIDFGGEGFSFRRLAGTVDAARDGGFSSISVNDHFLFGTPWLDGPTALAAMVERSGRMTLMTTLSLASLRGPVPLAKALVALDVLSDGRLVAGLGPGSSILDYQAVGVAFEDRWARFDEATALVRSLLHPGAAALSGGIYYPTPPAQLLPPPRQDGGIPLWIGSWGSGAGMRRVARLGDGWLASAYNTTPQDFAAKVSLLHEELAKQKRPTDGFPHALATMWAWVTEAKSDADRVLSETLGPLLKREPAELARHVCVGPPEQCAELLSKYARAGCEHVLFWPVGDERRQVEVIADRVIPLVSGSA